MAQGYGTPHAVDEMTQVTSYRDVGAILNSGDARQALHRSEETASEWGPGPSDAFIGDSVISLNGDAHFERRRLESALFTKAGRGRMELDIVLPLLRRQLAEHLEAAPSGEADLVTFTRLVLIRLSGAVVGLAPIEDYASADRLRILADGILSGVTAGWATADREEILRRALEARDAFASEFYDAARAAATLQSEAKDIISLLVTTPGSVRSEDVLFREAALFLIASSSTTTNALQHAVWDLEHWLADHPEARADLGSFPFCRRVANEALRLHPTIPGLMREMTAPVTLPSGLELEEGEFVFLDLLRSARDPEVFGPAADAFDPFRKVPKGVLPFAYTFGGGPHMCMGRTLAVGDAGSSDDPADPQGVLTRLLHEFYGWGLTLDTEQEPRRQANTAKDDWATFPVTFTRKVSRT
jgi:cytochrome P450